ncbi:MAG: Fe-S cluster assembly ATPase SufC [Candidatus Aenigmarchaeota archaeon]|nr:Fe-S cluster assembly ATPase SufC [Candidatus Aenigmarchaeota archaeon]
MTELEIKDLHVSVAGKKILNGVNLKIKQGELHALMGPNGSGKSTLSYALMGHPKYKIEGGEILIDGEGITQLKPDKRAKLGLFLGFQYPVEVPGVTLKNFMWKTYKSMNNGNSSFVEFNEMFSEKLESLGMDKSFATRYLNEGFSGGEKKRAEVLQLSVLKPKIAICDEIDSGTDVDALKIVANGLKKAVEENTGILLITHYQRILNHVKPDFVHVLIDGRIVKSGDYNLAKEIEEKGYEAIANG